MFGLGKRLRELFGSQPERLDLIEDTLLEADIGPRTVDELLEGLDGRLGRGEQALATIRGRVLERLRAAAVEPGPTGVSVVMAVGVNGVGKTTNLAKLGALLKRNGRRVLFAAADTFRAAAAEQLGMHGQRLGIPVVAQGQGADAGAVLFDAIDSATARSVDIVLADTSGRMHTNAGLDAELRKLVRIAERRRVALHRLLVVDATTGRNAFDQARTFRDGAGVDSILLSKLDATAKGGVVLDICHQLELGVSFVGTGERMEDLSRFDPATYVTGLLGDGRRA
ncbi:MAG: signal recognition particle-docking protein FtsY [Spirochaetaceae bacterium]|nr:signal recognition particle-docking protein FtsY [Spirochaetaceae bacterium]